jgi:hypothetical protein
LIARGRTRIYRAAIKCGKRSKTPPQCDNVVCSRPQATNRRPLLGECDDANVGGWSEGTCPK